MKYLLGLILISFSFSKDTLKVAVSPFEPLVIMGERESVTGFDIDIWEAIADKLNVETEYVIVDDFQDIFYAVKNKKADLAIAGITVNHEREIEFDFSYPYKKSGLTILIRNEKEFNIFKAIVELFKGSFIHVCGFLIVYILIITIANIIDYKKILVNI